ncbi:MAG: cysteine desulfurase family protein [Ornithinimicrobium sp.]
MTVYLDHAATTPVLPEVIDIVAATMRDVGNASSLHTAGRSARRVVEESRESIAEDLGVRPSEVVFTSGGTESDNMAVKGTLWQQAAADPARRRLLISAIEHHAVLDPVEYLVQTGQADVTWLRPDSDGVIQPATLHQALTEHGDTAAVVSVMWANNETGVVQPVCELATMARAAGVPLHTDAVQAVGHVPLDLGSCRADLITMTGHKLGGPLGVGVLIAGRDQTPVPLTHGGGQERQLRSGTLDVPGISGLAVAVRVAVADQAAESKRLGALRDMLIEGAMSIDPSITVNGAWSPGDVTSRLPGNAHLRVPDCDGDSLLYLLDAAGVQCSTGSACQAGVPQPSHVLLAMGLTEAQARGALRLSLGHTSTQADVEAFLGALPSAIDRARRARLATDRAS